VGEEKSDPFSPSFAAIGPSSMFLSNRNRASDLLVRCIMNLTTSPRLRAVLEHGLDERGAVLARVPLQAVRPWVGSGVDAVY